MVGDTERGSVLETKIEERRKAAIAVWKADSLMVKKDFNDEQRIVEGGYGDRQIFELVQNANDAAKNAKSSRIKLVRAGAFLYAANTGAAITPPGIEALTMNGLSPKDDDDEDGQFGLGFRSLLRFDGTIDMFSGGIGFQFDPGRCGMEARKAARLPEGADAPGLRMAWMLDRNAAAKGDPVLAELLEWADTVARCELGASTAAADVDAALGSFPAEFLLFAIPDITMEILTPDLPMRTIGRTAKGDRVQLSETGKKPVDWHVVRQRVKVTDTPAQQELGQRRREYVRLQWAVPVDGTRISSGQFWRGGFPTKSPNPVPGILNAPWKVSDDRTNLVGKLWNAHLMALAGNMVAEHLPDLASDEDPGRPIGLLPRQIAEDEPGAPLSRAMWERIAEKDIAFVANGDGNLVKPAGLYRAPFDHKNFQEQWGQLVGTGYRQRYVHPTCVANPDRISRLEYLAAALKSIDEDQPRLKRQGMKTWLEECASIEFDDASLLLPIVESLSKTEHRWKWDSELKQAAIIPTAHGKLAAAASVVFPGPDGDDHGLATVDSNIAANDELRRILVDVLGVSDADEAGWEKRLKSLGVVTSEEGWALIAKAPHGVRDRYLAANREKLKVLTYSGNWYPVNEVLLPGEIIPADELEDSKYRAVAPEFAGRYALLLTALGISDVPSDTWPSLYPEKTLTEALEAARKRYRENGPKAAAKPQDASLGYRDAVTVPNGLWLLPYLGETARARLTQLLLLRMLAKPPKPISFGGVGSGQLRDRYPGMTLMHPALYTLLNRRKISINGETPFIVYAWNTWSALNPDDSDDAAVRILLPDFAPWNASLELRDAAFSKETIWPEILGANSSRDHAELLPIWRSAARRGFAPATVPFGDEDLLIDQVYIAGKEDDVELAADAEICAVLLDDDRAEPWRKAGALPLADIIEHIDLEPIDGPIDINDHIDGLSTFLRSDALEFYSCAGIETRICDAARAYRVSHENGRVYLVLEEWSFEHFPDREAFIGFLEHCDLLAAAHDTASVLAALDTTDRDKKRAQVAKLPNLQKRLLAAAGSVGALVEALPDAIRDLASEATDDEVAQLCLDIHGPAALRELETTLVDRGLGPPDKWGGAEAEAFVASLGFPRPYAGARSPRLAAELLVDGPLRLGALHDYQRDVVDQIVSLTEGRGPERRAKVSLPTGAGKTRVAVEGALRHLLKTESPKLVVWVAQTEELAEQAIDTFRRVWANVAPEESTLRLIRLWGGQSNPPRGDPKQPTVVVALVQTLVKRLGKPAAEWLRAPSMLVIDESHHGIAASYTELLDGLGFATGAAMRAKQRATEPVLLGLTATPFRSAGEEQSRLLANRFEAKVIPPDQNRLYENLQQDGFLATLRMQELPGVNDFELILGELQEIETFGQLPEAAQKRLAENLERNERILEAIRAAPEQSILVFANTVAHAQMLAARLSLDGIRARSVSGETDRSSRRDAVRAFRDGEVRVICNAQVFTTGFDAPKVDLILISRAVTSPVRFMQMIGRGLRGPKNGGTPSCRILTVEDNIIGYSGRRPIDWWREYYG